ncbi:MAG TPA: phage tail tube protein [Polaromonas sp.]|uniref:phage tail tube protein n=1 Tax=Polaromonas sp. TaxID=1869339 RepID=UPI002D5E9038|nr:phage tail tube protein [Polaromonas sp.]HYW57677.1 phage tail tube protein [Polaromonas sp.]
MPCPTQTMRVTTVTFNGINHTPINKTAKIKLGGEIDSDGVMDNAGKYFGGTAMEPSEVEFEIPNTADFNPENYRGQCGDLMFLTSAGVSYLVTNARLGESIEVEDGSGKVKLMFKGDAAVVY